MFCSVHICSGRRRRKRGWPCIIRARLFYAPTPRPSLPSLFPPPSLLFSLSISICISIARLSHRNPNLSKQPKPKASQETKEGSKPSSSESSPASNGSGPRLRVRGDGAPARPARWRCGLLRRQEGLRRDHRPEAEVGAGRRADCCRGGSSGRGGRGRGCEEGAGGGEGGDGRRRREHEEVTEPEQRHHRRSDSRPRGEAARAQGAGGGMAAGPVVPEEPPGGEVLVSGCGSGVREGEHGRRAVPAQGGPEDVQDLPGPLQGAREDVQLLHHRKLWISRDERHEREQADGSTQRIRVCSDVRRQGRRLDARRRCPVGDVRRVMQAPPDNERIRSYWPCAKGDGEMQEQELRRACTK